MLKLVYSKKDDNGMTDGIKAMKDLFSQDLANRLNMPLSKIRELADFWRFNNMHAFSVDMDDESIGVPLGALACVERFESVLRYIEAEYETVEGNKMITHHMSLLWESMLKYIALAMSHAEGQQESNKTFQKYIKDHAIFIKDFSKLGHDARYGNGRDIIAKAKIVATDFWKNNPTLKHNKVKDYLMDEYVEKVMTNDREIERHPFNLVNEKSLLEMLVQLAEELNFPDSAITGRRTAQVKKTRTTKIKNKR